MNDVLHELQERVKLARAHLTQAQYDLMAAQQNLWNEQYQAYMERLELFAQEHQGPVDSVLWWQSVRPLCQDCRQEITEPYDHDMLARSGEPIMLACGHRSW